MKEGRLRILLNRSLHLTIKIGKKNELAECK